MVQNIRLMRSRNYQLKLCVTGVDSNRYIPAEGDEFIFGVKRFLTDTELCIKKSALASDFSNGECIFYISASDTDSLVAPGDYYYDVGMKTAAGNYYSVIETSRLHLICNVTSKEA